MSRSPLSRISATVAAALLALGGALAVTSTATAANGCVGNYCPGSGKNVCIRVGSQWACTNEISKTDM